MKTKKKSIIKQSKRKFNFKIFLLLLVLCLGGYFLYKNLASPADIYVVTGDGLEAEEAAFIKKTTVKKGAPAPVVKVTVERPDGQQFTSKVTLKKSDNAENEDTNNNGKKNETSDFAAQISNQVLKDNGEAPLVYANGTPVQSAIDSPSQQAGATVTTTNGGTCSAGGSPVLEGTWVATGRIYNDDSSQRECVKCGAGGKYEGSMSCSAAFKQGLPMVLPTGGGVPYTGKDISVKACFIKVNGSFVQVGAGYSSDGSVCTPDGKMTKSTDALGLMDKYCKDANPTFVYKDGKCQDNSAQIALEAAKKSEDELKRAEAEKKERTENCIKSGYTTWNPKTRVCEGKNEVDIKYRTNYDTESECKTKAGKSDVCKAIQGGGYGIVPASSNISSISYNSGTTSGRPSSLTNNIYKDENTCKLALKGGEVCQVSSSGSFGSTGNGYTIVADKSAANTKDRTKYVEYTFGSPSNTGNTPSSTGNNDTLVTSENPDRAIDRDQEETTQVALNVGESCGSGYLTWGCKDKCGGHFTTINVEVNGGFDYKSNYCGSPEDIAKLGITNSYTVVKETVLPSSSTSQNQTAGTTLSNSNSSSDVGQNGNTIGSKSTGESCSNSLIGNTCKFCAGGNFSLVGRGSSRTAMCGTESEVTALVNKPQVLTPPIITEPSGKGTQAAGSWVDNADKCQYGGTKSEASDTFYVCNFKDGTNPWGVGESNGLAPAKVVGMEAEQISSKPTGESCSNSLIGNTCKFCEGGNFSLVSRGSSRTAMCGTESEVTALVNKPQVLTPPIITEPSGKGTQAAGSWVDNADKCQYGGTKSEASDTFYVCNFKDGTNPWGVGDGSDANAATITQSAIPSVASQTIASAGVGATVGGVVAGGLCALGVTIAGGGIGIAAAFPAYTTCAAVGATVVGSITGVTSYANASAAQEGIAQPSSSLNTSGNPSGNPSTPIIDSDNIRPASVKSKEVLFKASDGNLPTDLYMDVYVHPSGKYYNDSFCDDNSDCLSNHCNMPTFGSWSCQD